MIRGEKICRLTFSRVQVNRIWTRDHSSRFQDRKRADAVVDGVHVAENGAELIGCGPRWLLVSSRVLTDGRGGKGGGGGAAVKW